MIERNQSWFVVFTSSPKGSPWHWWDVFTRPGFRHVVLFTYSEDKGIWFYIDWTDTGLKVWLLSSREMSSIMGIFNKRDATVVKMAQGERYSEPWFTSVYCVAAVRHILGIPGWMFLTPYYLYRKMIKLGAEVVTYHPVWGKGH